MPVGAAIAGGLGLAGSLGSSYIQSNAAKSASNAQVQLGQQALGIQQSLGQQGIQALMKMFGIAQDTVQPVINAGLNVASGQGTNVLNAGQGIVGQGQGIINGVLPTLQALTTPGANMTQTLSQLPGFQFAQDWGQKAVQNLGTTTGLGGNVLKAGADYATGVAQQGYGNYVGQLQALLNSGTNVINSGTSLSGVGGNLIGAGLNTASSSANALAGAAVNTGNSAFSNLNQESQNIGNTLTGIGNSTASGILGSANATAGGLTSGTNSITNSLLLNKLFGGGGSSASAGNGIYGAAATQGLNGLPAIS